MKLGANFHAVWSFYTPERLRWMLERFAEMGIAHVRIDFEWRVLNPQRGQWDTARLDPVIVACREVGIVPLVMLYSSPTWATQTASGNAAPLDPTDYGRALVYVAKKYGCAVQMWNEPDKSKFWASGSPERFAGMVKGAYSHAKAEVPDGLFVLGAPTYLGLATKWFERLYAVGTQGHYDVMACHPYLSPSNLPPEANAIGIDRAWSIVGIDDLRALRSGNGDTTPLWATEWGWSTHADYPNTSTKKVENWQRGVTEAQQATYTVDALPILASKGIERAYVYVDRDLAITDPHEANFGLFRKDWTAKPVVDALISVANPVPRLEARIAELEGDLLATRQQVTDLNGRWLDASTRLTDLRARVRAELDR